MPEILFFTYLPFYMQLMDDLFLAGCFLLQQSLSAVNFWLTNRPH